MPYIKRGERLWLERPLKVLVKKLELAPIGAVNYCITVILLGWLGKPSYERYNAALGVLEAAKLELYRRKIAEYENDAVARNGDVF